MAGPGATRCGRVRRRLAGATAAVALLAIAAVGARQAAAASPDLLVFAAASTRDALEAVARHWEQASGTRVRLSFAASSALARQLEQGAPADLYVSADVDWMDYLRQRGLLRDDSIRPLLGNRLVLVASANSSIRALEPTAGFGLAAALGGGRLAVADVRAVPAGRYARAALESLGVWEGVRSRLAMSENVRAALALVARGEAPLGIVYASDAHEEPRVRVVGTFPEGSHPPIRYPVAITRASRHPDAEAFHALLFSDRAAALFREHGFTPLR